MARTKQINRRLIGGRAPKKNIAHVAARKFAPFYRDWQLYEVYSIVDRREGPDGKPVYKAQWLGEEYINADTYEPRAWLFQFKFHRDVKPVDEWKSTTEPDFFRFLAGRGIELGDSVDGFCAFRAIERAVALLGQS